MSPVDKYTNCNMDDMVDSADIFWVHTDKKAHLRTNVVALRLNKIACTTLARISVFHWSCKEWKNKKLMSLGVNILSEVLILKKYIPFCTRFCSKSSEK